MIPVKKYDSLFNPKVVVHVGASDAENSPGVPAVPRGMFENLLAGAKNGRKVYAVNPGRATKGETVLGQACYKDVASVPEDKIDVVVCTLPAKLFPQILEMIEQCHKKGVDAIVMPSAGFSEAGPEGVEQERKIKSALVDENGHQIILDGTNCLGVVAPWGDFNPTFLTMQPPKGHVSFFSQSGGMVAPVASQAKKQNFGFRHIVSIGSGLDIGMNDLFAYAAQDPETHAVAAYIEGVRDPQGFFDGARDLLKANKPIIAIHPGKSEAAGEAAKSHTGSMVGADDVFEAAMYRAGIVRVESIEDFYNVILLLDKIRVTRGKYSTCLLSHAGGPGVIATDAGGALGIQMTKLSSETLAKLNAVLPKIWSHANPVDMTGGVGAKEYYEATKILLEAEEVHLLHVTLAPIITVRPTDVADAIIRARDETANGKPLVVSFMAGDEWKEHDGMMAKAREKIRDAGIPDIDNPDMAIRAMHFLVRREQIVSEITEGEKPERLHENCRAFVKEMILAIRDQNRTILTTEEALKIFEQYGIPVVDTWVVKSSIMAPNVADCVGYPVVIKLRSKTEKGSHKTDVGGVKLNVKNAKEVRDAFNEIKKSVTEKIGAEHFEGVTIQPMADMSGYEILLGKKTDSIWGSAIAFGFGGTDAELWNDKVVTLPGLTESLALRLIKKTKISKKLLNGWRGKPAADMNAVVKAFVAISQLAEDFPEIDELDINPAMADKNGLLVVDGRITLLLK